MCKEVSKENYVLYIAPFIQENAAQSALQQRNYKFGHQNKKRTPEINIKNRKN